VFKWLEGKKSYATAIGLVLTSVGGVLSGEISPLMALLGILSGGGIASARAGATREVKKRME
jgi:hypothetical protein